MPVKVVDLQHVEIDGASVGCVADAMLNFRAQAGEVQTALVEWSKGFADIAAKEARDSVQESLDKANTDLASAIGRSDQLTAQLASQQEAYTADCNAIKAAYESSLKELSDNATAQITSLQNQLKATIEANEKQFAELAKAANEQITVLQVNLQKVSNDLAWHQRRANLATEMINHLYTGDSAAAVASTLELRRIELTARQAQLDAEKLQLEPAA